MTNDLITKIKDLVEGMESPSPTFMYESFENANVVIDGMTFTKLMILQNITTGNLGVIANNITLEPPLNLYFCRSMDLQDYQDGTTLKTIYDGIMDDVVLFIKYLVADTTLKKPDGFEFELYENFLDYNLAAIRLTFTTKILSGTCVNLNC